MNCKQLFGITLIWVFKFDLFAESQKCTFSIYDPEWKNMWYLNNPNTNKYDMNVLTAWESCANGTGVTVGVVDNGIQDHADLNIDRNMNAGYTNKSKQGNPTRSRQSFKTRPRSAATRKRQYQASLKHGTRVAGIVAAKKNGQGIIGIAFGATLVDVRIASTSVFETFNASLLTHQSDVIDVYSCSFANFHTGTKTYPLTANQEKAFQEGTTYGRQGRGSVYVFATGNSGGKRTNLFRDSCAYDRLVTNRYVVSVAGIQHNLRKLPNGEACSALMIAAFTTKPGVKKNRGAKVITTTDIGNKTTLHFNQNSAAAPMVSGAVALALSANPLLTYRDIMHLLVNTASGDLLKNKNKKKFITNAAGFKVSSYFGFGLLDIGALVERSKSWELVPDRQSCHSTEIVDNPMGDGYKYLVLKVSGCNVTYVEHVEVSLIVNHQYAGQIQWSLISPNKTKSTIIPGRILDQTTTMKLTVLTVQMWGENSKGYWKLEPKPAFRESLGKGTVKSARLLIHGYSSEKTSTLPPALQVPINWTGWSEWSECTDSCGPENKTRTRRCNDRKNSRYCIGNNFMTVSCDNNECLEYIPHVDVTPDNATSSDSGSRTDECQSSSHLTSRCVEQCSHDRDCSVRQKCCYNGCGHTCEMSRESIEPTLRTAITTPKQVREPTLRTVINTPKTDRTTQSVRTSPKQVQTPQTARTTPEQDQTTQTIRITTRQDQTTETDRTEQDQKTQTVRTTSEQDKTTRTVRITTTQDQTSQTVRKSTEQDQTTRTVRTTPEQETQTVRSSTKKVCTDEFADCDSYVKNVGGCKPYVKNYCKETCRICV